MRCRPGDLAIFVHPIGTPNIAFDARNVGKLVKVLRRAGRSSWWILCHSDFHRRYSPCPAGHECVTFDAFLRPLRDPGEDAVDEMLRPLPAEPVPA